MSFSTLWILAHAIYRDFFKKQKFKISSKKVCLFFVVVFLCVFFSYFCSKHTLWVHVRTASLSNEYPQCMFLIKNKKNGYTPANHKWGYAVSMMRGALTHHCIRAASWENQQGGFRTGPTQTSLYKHRKELEA